MSPTHAILPFLAACYLGYEVFLTAGADQSDSAVDPAVAVLGRDLSPGGKAERWVDSFRDEPALLFLFRSDCPACHKNLARWRELTGAVATQFAFRRVASPTDEGRAEFWPDGPKLLAVGLDQPVWSGAVPMTLLVDSKGVVVLAKAGILSEGDVSELVISAGALVTARGRE